jgi:hypothetical protein
MQEAQGSIAKDTVAVCMATILLVALLAGAAILWRSPPPQEARARFQVEAAEAQTVEAAARASPFIF